VFQSDYGEMHIKLNNVNTKVSLLKKCKYRQDNECVYLALMGN